MGSDDDVHPTPMRIEVLGVDAGCPSALSLEWLTFVLNPK